MCPMADLMVVMADEEAISYYEEIVTIGHYYTCAMTDTSWPVMAKVVQRIEASVKTDKTR